MPNGHSDKERLVALEVGQRDLRDDLNQGMAAMKSDLHEIKTNHLAHLGYALTRVQWLLVAFMLLYLFGPDAIAKLKLVTGI